MHRSILPTFGTVEPWRQCVVQSETREAARLSCACCIFTHQHHLRAALQAQPEIVASFVRDVPQFEADTGATSQ